MAFPKFVFVFLTVDRFQFLLQSQRLQQFTKGGIQQ